MLELFVKRNGGLTFSRSFRLSSRVKIACNLKYVQIKSL